MKEAVPVCVKEAVPVSVPAKPGTLKLSAPRKSRDETTEQHMHSYVPTRDYKRVSIVSIEIRQNANCKFPLAFSSRSAELKTHFDLD